MRNENMRKRSLATRAGFGMARPNLACDEGFQGPLTEPQTDGSRRTTIGAKTASSGWRTSNFSHSPPLTALTNSGVNSAIRKRSCSCSAPVSTHRMSAEELAAQKIDKS
jgi:hypothetical protein